MNEGHGPKAWYPAIGTGIAGFPIDRCADVMLTEFRDHLSGATTLERIEMVLYDEASLKIFERALARVKE